MLICGIINYIILLKGARIMTMFSRFEELSSNFYDFLTDFNPLGWLEDFVENTGIIVPIIFLSVSIMVLLISSEKG